MAKTNQAVRRSNASRGQGSDGGGEDSGRRVIAIVVTVLVIVALVYVGWSLATDPQDEIAARTEELQAEEVERDREQIGELTDQALGVASELTPVLDAMIEAMPPGEEPGPVADADTVAEWQETSAAAAALFEDPPSGSTGTNVARNAIAVSAGTFLTAADTYALAIEAEGEQQQALIEQAGAQRDLAVRSWSIGATQLDQINIDAGFGHRHVYLEAEGTGALTPDGAADGDEATGN